MIKIEAKEELEEKTPGDLVELLVKVILTYQDIGRELAEALVEEKPKEVSLKLQAEANKYICYTEVIKEVYNKKVAKIP